jgi:hypothetical protein
MFKTISNNTNIKQGKATNEKTLINMRHQTEFGKKEWQQDWKSLGHRDYNEKQVNSFKSDGK